MVAQHRRVKAAGGQAHPAQVGDRTEQRDLIKEQPELAKKMETQWTAWAERTFVDDWPGPDHTDWGMDIKPQ